LQRVVAHTIGMRALCILVLGFVASDPVIATVTDDLRYTSYPVHYRDRVPLKVLLARATPRHAGRGMIIVGWTAPKITWKMQLETLADRHCRVHGVRTLLSTTITLPASDDPEISQDGDFRVFLTRLKAHELGHYKIAQTAAAEIDRGISKLPPAASCTALQRKANQLGSAILANMWRQQSTYDASNDHGMSYGDALE
jgi:predicted secreted Zn-dependent protease